MLDNTRIRQLAHQHLTGVGDHCIINFARALIEEAARSTIAAPAQVEWTDQWNCKNTVPIEGAANLLKEMFDAWPGGLEEIESSIKQWRERAEAAEAKVAALVQEPVVIDIELVEDAVHGGLHIRYWNARSPMRAGKYTLYADPAAPVVPEWQPIETAPLNKNVLLWWRPIDDNKYAECAVIGQISFYEQGQWWNGQTGTYQDIWHVTKWMPAPAAPKPDA